MVRKVEISIGEIGKQIKQAERKLLAAGRGVTNSAQKKRVAAKVRALKKVGADLKRICKGYNIDVPQGGSGK